MRNINQSLLKKKKIADETNRTSQANSDSYKTNSNAKKGAFNEARSSEEEHVGMRDIIRKGDFEHSNEESMETAVMRRRINYLSVVGKVTLKI